MVIDDLDELINDDYSMNHDASVEYNDVNDEDYDHENGDGEKVFL